jgi:hypothetical protein
MGYEVHITRARNWWESESTPIPLSEWLRYVASDEELRRDDEAEAELGDGCVLRYENPGLVVWTAYSRDGEGGNMAWLDFRDGRVVAKNPDEEILTKLCSIADSLGARVQGDDGEYYPSESSREEMPEGAEPEDRSKGARLLGTLRDLFRRARPVGPAESPFHEGQRLRYRLGGTCTVVKVDPRAYQGLGALTLRFDDGRVLTFSLAGDPRALLEPL